MLLGLDLAQRPRPEAYPGHQLCGTRWNLFQMMIAVVDSIAVASLL